MAVYTRKLAAPKQTFFLLGPRGTGKSFWLHEHFPKARRYDLLRSSEHLRLLKDPSVLRQEVEALPRGSWVVIDEVQKLPQILDEVHSLITDSRNGYHFALTGSSARKLKRSGANLLPARSINRSFYPLTLAECGGTPDIDGLLRWGGLPALRAALDDGNEDSVLDLLEAYVQNYLKLEIQEEAAVKRLDSFVRFLEVAAIANAQVTNVAGIARDAAVQRPTVQGYFEVLTETLIGTWLPAWRKKPKVKQVAHPKFYFFDTGVVRALTGRLREPLDSVERGTLLETWVFHELRAHIAYSGCGGELSYWRTPAGNEVDFIWSRGPKSVGIEVKSSSRWRPEWSKTLNEMVDEGHIKTAIGVYTGTERLKIGHMRIMPLGEFTRALGDWL